MLKITVVNFYLDVKVLLRFSRTPVVKSYALAQRVMPQMTTTIVKTLMSVLLTTTSVVEQPVFATTQKEGKFIKLQKFVSF